MRQAACCLAALLACAVARADIVYDARLKAWVDAHGVCSTCTPAAGFPNPPAIRDGWYYDPVHRAWRDAQGHRCPDAECAPARGFPVQPYPPASPPEAGTDEPAWLKRMLAHERAEVLCGQAVLGQARGKYAGADKVLFDSTPLFRKPQLVATGSVRSQGGWTAFRLECRLDAALRKPVSVRLDWGETRGFGGPDAVPMPGKPGRSD